MKTIDDKENVTYETLELGRLTGKCFPVNERAVAACEYIYRGFTINNLQFLRCTVSNTCVSLAIFI